MEVVSELISGWLPPVAATIAILGGTYKLNRDLRADLLDEISKNRREMLENKQEILDHFHAHIHDSGSGEVLLRALASRQVGG